MNSNVAESEALRMIEDQMRRMIAGDATPYDAGWVIYRTAMSAIPSPECMHPLWLIWGALTDWVELRPDETTQAEATMLRAAKEWLSLPSMQAHARVAYLDRWVYDELGIDERTTAEPSAPPADQIGSRE